MGYNGVIMERSGDLFIFDDTDRNRFEGFPNGWVPVEAIPEIFQKILDAQLDNGAEIQRLNGNDTHDRNYAEYLAELQQLHVRSIRLQAAANELGELAGAELIDAMLPAPAA
jgi:hypothetical protein